MICLNTAIRKTIVSTSIFISLILSSHVLASETSSIDVIVDEIRTLEKQREPKCYATASRLEDFMFGTPLSNEARFKKNQLQKTWVKKIWTNATELALKNNQKTISEKLIDAVLIDQIKFSRGKDMHWDVKFLSDKDIRINKDDKRQYSSIAYGLRAILAVQQEFLLGEDYTLLPLQKNAIQKLKNSLDFLSLSVLKIADTQARKNNKKIIDKASLTSVWSALTLIDNKKHKFIKDKNNNIPKTAGLNLIRKIINQKVDSYSAYNKVSNQLFIRNLQVYYARLSWPKSPSEGKKFKLFFTDTLIQFAADLYLESEKIALARGHNFIQEDDVNELVQNLIPHEVNQYEDVIFFPKLKKDKKVTIDSYDMDSFRDSGIHWQYLKYAINSSSFKSQLQPDPFALELIVENIAQFGVLSLRVAGNVGKQDNAKRISQDYYVQGLKIIQQRIDENQLIKTTKKSQNSIVSSIKREKSTFSGEKKFKDITTLFGVDFMHRSSDWLNRLLRSYLLKSKGVGVITIPPAFGGSGIAAEDINNDGYTDLLILSGLGNQLLINQNGMSFKDITKSAGLIWNRPQDNRPGEPRQPIIADLNNDGLEDIVITYVNDNHRVYRNLGNGKFKDVTAQSNLGGIDLVAGPATVADFDNDGLLDIYVTYFGLYTKGVLPTLKRRNDNGLKNQLFKNLGNFKFKNITKYSGTGHSGWAQAVTHTDFNNDGYQDLIVGNDFGVNAYFQNDGKSRFKDVSTELGTDKPSYTMNISIADLNQDLIPDIYISNIVTMNKDEKYVNPNEDTPMKFDTDKLAKMRVVEANDLFLSSKSVEGKITYSLSDDVGRGYSSTGWSWGANFLDYDNDGDSDLYVLNGMNEFNLYSNQNPYYTDPIHNKKANVYIPVSTKESNVFFENKDGKLINESQNSGLDLIGNSRSASYLDIDRDGDLDIALNNYHGKAKIYENELDKKTSHWIKIKLVGNVEKNVNRDAIGGKIIIQTKNGQKIWREIRGSEGYMSVNPKIQHFGLGKEEIKSIQIIWPNHEVQELRPLPINQEYIVYQGHNAKIYK